MKIIPVIDLMRRQVVHGVGGNRQNYLPISSRLSSSARPADVAHGLAQVLAIDGSDGENFGATDGKIYVADLDAIGGNEPDWEALEQITAAATGAGVLLDAGAATADQAQSLLSGLEHLKRPTGCVASRVVVGLETLARPTELDAMFQRFATERIVVSIDLRDGKPITQIAQWQDCSAKEIIENAIKSGATSFILLDLAGVGSAAGVSTLGLCQWLRTAEPDSQIISGGGVRSLDDLRAMKQAGCDAALVATALHNGAIGREEIARLRADL